MVILCKPFKFHLYCVHLKTKNALKKKNTRRPELSG